jgi:hypothetical protein
MAAYDKSNEIPTGLMDFPGGWDDVPQYETDVGLGRTTMEALENAMTHPGTPLPDLWGDEWGPTDDSVEGPMDMFKSQAPGPAGGGGLWGAAGGALRSGLGAHGPWLGF